MEKINAKTLIISLVIFLVLVFIGMGFWIYLSDNPRMKSMAKAFNFPGVIIGYTNFISIKEIDENVDSVRKFYENQDFSKVGYRVDFSTEEGKKKLKLKEKEVIDKMIEDRVIKILAREKGVKISKKTVDQNLNRKLAEYGTQKSVEENLQKQYGWTLEDFKEKVVMPSMYSEVLGKKIEKDLLSRNSDNSEKIKKAEEEIENGKEFEAVVRKYSEGNKEENGNLGWFKANQLDKRVSKTAFSLEKGEVSEILESDLGYHIIRLEDKKNEEGEELVNLSQIFVSKITFADWLGEEIKKMKIMIPMSDYKWNNEKGIVEFEKEELKEFEQKEEQAIIDGLSEEENQ